MNLKKVVLTLVSVTLALSILGVSVSAEKRNLGNTVCPMYEIAKRPKSNLLLFGTEAICSSNTSGTNAKIISAEQILEQNQGLTTWSTVSDATWVSTVNSNSISVQNTKSGLSSGTYRLKTVFTLTNTNGKTETVTVYSDEKTVT